MKLRGLLNRRMLAACVLATSVPAVLAFTLNGKRWAGSSMTFYAGMPGKPASSTTTWAAALEAAMKEWNDKTEFEFVVDKSYVDPCEGYSRNAGGSFPNGAGNNKNSADFTATVCGNDFGSSVLAITLTTADGGNLGFNHLREADIVFNSRYSWDIYNGPRTSAIDFGRVALHEFGHALGLDHESTAVAIMAPRITDLSALQTDDIAGANALYGNQIQCRITQLQLNAQIRNSLEQPDCRVMELYGFGSDDSFVDVYKLSIATPTRLFIDMRSSQMDPVIVLTDSKLKELDIFDDSPGSCNAHMEKVLAAGDYYILANTYSAPRKCVSNIGAYTLSITDSPQPQLGEAGTTSGITPAAALFTGGASADGGQTFRTSFAATETIDVNARIAVDPLHVGRSGRVFVLIQLSNGTKYSRNSAGQYLPFNGNLAQLTSYKSGALINVEEINVANGLRAAGTNLAGLSYAVYIGYALDSQPDDIHYGNKPIQFSIGP
ncbi:MAG: matrixin family metalloprotease [Pseudomonadota bacterium]